MRTLDTYIGIEPFTVKVDDSPQLRELAQKARELRKLPFTERLSAVKKLTVDAMVNAYEQMIVFGQKANELEIVARTGEDGKANNSKYLTKYLEAKTQYERFRDIVVREHPLSYALEKNAGCCRYQGALFFVLSYEADLGDKHFIQAAPVNSRVNSVFNELVIGGKSQVVSIFTESLRDKSLDYSRQNPKIFEQAIKEVPGLNMYSYHRTPSGLIIVENPIRHITELRNIFS